jgi:hypothetical protein
MIPADAILLASNRATVVGPDIAREYRYQPESGALFVIGAGLALLPLAGAIERNPLRDGASVAWERRYAAPVVAVVVTLALVSSTSYIHTWQSGNRTREYFDNVRATLSGQDEPPALVDAGIPQDLLWSYRTPENTYSHIFRELGVPLRFPSWAGDLYMLDDNGKLAPVVFDLNAPSRSMVPTTGCGYRFVKGTMTIPLDGPVIGDGWWIRMFYRSPGPAAIEVLAGDLRHRIDLPASHDGGVYFSVAGQATAIVIHPDGPATPATGPKGLCVTGLMLGLPIAGNADGAG